MKSKEVHTLRLAFIDGEEDALVLDLGLDAFDLTCEGGIITVYLAESVGPALAQHLGEEYHLVPKASKSVQ